MIEPYSATTIIIGFLIIFGILIPIIGNIPKIRNIISYRYLIIVCFLACMLGVIINFSELDTSVRLAVIIGSIILCSVFILVRSLEKWMYNGWSLSKDLKAIVQKGDAKAEIEIKKAESDK
jgi:CDP-diglyceride synthetase